MHHDELLGFIDDIYEAALEPERWQQVLRAIGEATKNSTVVLQAVSPDSSDAEILRTHNMDPHLLRLYNDYYGSINPWFLSATQMLQAGMVVSGEEVVPTSALCKTEFYGDFLRPQNALYTLNAVLLMDSQMSSNVSLVRGPAEGQYDHEDCRLLKALIPHMQRALRVHRRVRGRSATIEALLKVFDNDQTGLVIVRSDGRAIYSNVTAENILAENDGITLTRNGRIRTLESKVNSRLGTLFCGSAFWAHTEVVAVKRPSGKPPLGIRITPYRGTDLDGFRKASLVMIRDPSRQPLPRECVLSELFGLTPTEAKVVSLLARDASVATIAEKLNLHTSTIRTHLKHALAKTGTRRQAELVRLVLRSIATLSDEEE